MFNFRLPGTSFLLVLIVDVVPYARKQIGVLEVTRRECRECKNADQTSSQPPTSQLIATRKLPPTPRTDLATLAIRVSRPLMNVSLRLCTLKKRNAVVEGLIQGSKSPRSQSRLCLTGNLRRHAVANLTYETQAHVHNSVMPHCSCTISRVRFNGLRLCSVNINEESEILGGHSLVVSFRALVAKYNRSELDEDLFLSITEANPCYGHPQLELEGEGTTIIDDDAILGLKNIRSVHIEMSSSNKKNTWGNTKWAREQEKDPSYGDKTRPGNMTKEPEKDGMRPSREATETQGSTKPAASRLLLMPMTTSALASAKMSVSKSQYQRLYRADPDRRLTRFPGVNDNELYGLCSKLFGRYGTAWRKAILSATFTKFFASESDDPKTTTDQIVWMWNED
ncbi:hypothetical protein BXZ70DRAFT_906866 [Cristinia sonorae]|uniref:Uncharacterized protein n=1 Tax=Cristinia sonorae TaxID=1940300 RepID=A0A8K0UP10_9AGAR|nr:hypothetical protein BXZ70DRAFT_906866 [Cristinia sonorae]